MAKHITVSFTDEVFRAIERAADEVGITTFSFIADAAERDAKVVNDPSWDVV